MKYSKVIGDGVIEGFSTRKDGSAKVSIVTQELSPDEAGALFGLNNQYVKFFITTEGITQIDMDNVDKISAVGGVKKKTKSQQLRAVAYRLWEQTESTQEFEVYYNEMMNRIIGWLKEKLN